MTSSLRSSLPAPILVSLLLASLGCNPTVPPGPSVAEPAADLAAALDPGEVRAGLLPAGTDPAAIGGVSGESRAGDWKLYNDRARFVVQGLRQGDYVMQQGGALIDLDIVRPAGAPDADFLDEHAVLGSLGRMLDGVSYELVSDGTEGPAELVVQGRDSLVELFAGALESDALFPELGLAIETRYRLDPDSWFLELSTTLTNESDESVNLTPGDLLLTSNDTGRPWHPGAGIDDMPDDPRPWVGAVTGDDQAALMIFGEEDFDPDLLGTISSLVDLIGYLAGSAPLEAGASRSFTRWIGVGPDLATLEAERRDRLGLASGELGGTVTSGGRPLEGARVHLLREGAPELFAVTDAEGRWQASVEPGSWELIITGEDDGLRSDLPPGTGAWAAYGTPAVNTRAHGPLHGTPTTGRIKAVGHPTLEAGVVEVSEGSSALDLSHALLAPGQLSLTLVDELGQSIPGRIEVEFLDPAPAERPELGIEHPGGLRAVTWLRDGAQTLALQPGRYRLHATHGVRSEVASQEIELVSGGAASAHFELARTVDSDGWVSLDPHSHAAPSNDAFITMEERLMVAAAHDIDFHVSTDHDHVADYRPVASSLGMDLGSIVGVETSPVLAGHFNVYPLEPQRTLPNGGAWLWYRDYSSTTSELLERLELQVGDRGVVQVNHGWESSGMYNAAGYDPDTGETEELDRYGLAYTTMEVNNAGSWEEGWQILRGLWNQGLAYTPVAVSDSHGHQSGRVGQVQTLVHTDGATEEGAVMEALIRGRSVATSGPTLLVDANGALPGDVLTGSSIELSVRLRAPSWMPLGEVQLWRNGALIETQAAEPLEGPRDLQFTFVDTPDEDAWYAVMVQTEERASEGYRGLSSWALSSAFWLDREADGFDPPTP